jgi:hypothetical protein
MSVIIVKGQNLDIFGKLKKFRTQTEAQIRGHIRDGNPSLFESISTFINTHKRKHEP